MGGCFVPQKLEGGARQPISALKQILGREGVTELSDWRYQVQHHFLAVDVVFPRRIKLAQYVHAHPAGACFAGRGVAILHVDLGLHLVNPDYLAVAVCPIPLPVTVHVP